MIGEHSGYAGFTVGQRKGLGGGGTEARFVLEALREQCATDQEFDAESRALGGG